MTHIQADTQADTQAEKVRADVARFDAVLEKILREKMLVEELAAKQAISRKQQSEVPKKAVSTKKAKSTKKAETAKNQEVANAGPSQLQKRTHASAAQGRSCTQAPYCTHRTHWTAVAGRSRCEHHSYSPHGYRNPFRFRCPGCRTIACGLCMKKLKRGDL